MISLCVLEGNEDLISFYKITLGPEFDFQVARSLKEFKALLITCKFDLIISANLLSDGSFLDWVKLENKKFMLEVPTLIVCCSLTLDSIKTYIALGAMDFIYKPFCKEELIARIEVAMRENVVRESSFFDLFIDKLTSTEKKIFQAFLINPGVFLSRELIEEIVWNKISVSSKSLNVHLTNLRKKLHGQEFQIDYQSDKGWSLLRSSCNKKNLTHQVPDLHPQ